MSTRSFAHNLIGAAETATDVYSHRNRNNYNVKMDSYARILEEERDNFVNTHDFLEDNWGEVWDNRAAELQREFSQGLNRQQQGWFTQDWSSISNALHTDIRRNMFEQERQYSLKSYADNFETNLRVHDPETMNQWVLERIEGMREAGYINVAQAAEMETEGKNLILDESARRYVANMLQDAKEQGDPDPISKVYSDILSKDVPQRQKDVMLQQLGQTEQAEKRRKQGLQLAHNNDILSAYTAGDLVGAYHMADINVSPNTDDRYMDVQTRIFWMDRIRSSLDALGQGDTATYQTNNFFALQEAINKGRYFDAEGVFRRAEAQNDIGHYREQGFISYPQANELEKIISTLSMVDSHTGLKEAWNLIDNHDWEGDEKGRENAKMGLLAHIVRMQNSIEKQVADGVITVESIAYEIYNRGEILQMARNFTENPEIAKYTSMSERDFEFDAKSRLFSSNKWVDALQAIDSNEFYGLIIRDPIAHTQITNHMIEGETSLLRKIFPVAPIQSLVRNDGGLIHQVPHPNDDGTNFMYKFGISEQGTVQLMMAFPEPGEYVLDVQGTEYVINVDPGEQWVAVDEQKMIAMFNDASPQANQIRHDRSVREAIDARENPINQLVNTVFTGTQQQQADAMAENLREIERRLAEGGLSDEHYNALTAKKRELDVSLDILFQDGTRPRTPTTTTYSGGR